jgi:hypothetical protein
MLLSFSHRGHVQGIGWHANIAPANSEETVASVLERLVINGERVAEGQWVTVKGMEFDDMLHAGKVLSEGPILVDDILRKHLTYLDVYCKPSVPSVRQSPPVGNVPVATGAVGVSKPARPKLADMLRRRSTLVHTTPLELQDLVKPVTWTRRRSTLVSDAAGASLSLRQWDAPAADTTPLELQDLVETVTWTHPRKYTMASKRPGGFDLIVKKVEGGFCSEAYLSTLPLGSEVNIQYLRLGIMTWIVVVLLL